MAVSPELARRSFRTSRRSTVGLQALKRYYTGEWSTGPKLRSVAPRTCGGSGKEPMKINRRDFLAAGAASLVMSRFRIRAAERLPLAFSTLGCPAWELSKSLDLPSRPEFAPERMAQTEKQIADHGIQIACVSSSTELHEPDATKREKGIADASSFIDLASALGAPNVRVFGNKLDGPREEIITRVASGMHQLGEYAGPRGVTVIIESHGDFVESATLKQVLTRAESSHVGLLWDAHHTYVDGHEPPEH